MSTDTIETDVALCDAEQRIAELRAEYDMLSSEEAEKDSDRLLDQILDLDVMIIETPVKTLAGAVYLLHRLVDPALGVSAHSHRPNDLHRNAIQHVLAVVEREAAKGGAS